MGYIDDALDEVRRATPTSGVNVCIYDDFEDVGDKLETIGNFDTVEEAQNFIDNYEGDAELVMYEAEVDEAEEKGTSDGAKKGWQTRQRGKTKLNTRLPSYTPQKNHSISNYISMAEDDYKKGTTRDNDEYEEINYRSNSKFNAPHRTIYEEKLNKDGTGVRRATRGLNPKKTNAKVLQFVYVSKSECEICRQYDGMAFATDSPNRPIIPRLESQGKKGTRPYTHPNCKCKWVRPFSDAGIKNFEQTRGNEDYDKVKTRLYKKAIAKYGNKFYNLPKSRKHYIIMQEIMKELKANETADPITALPVISMLKMTFDAIQPTLALQLNKMKHTHTNEVRNLIDSMVGEALTSERKHEIVLEHNLDFTFENLLDLTVTALEHDVWDEEKNKLVDPSLLEDKEEGDEGIDDEQYMPDVYNIDPYPHRHEFIDNVCIICDYVLKASESLILCPKCGSYAILNSELGSEWNKCDSCGEEFIEGAKPLQGQPTSSTNDYNVPVERDHAFGWDNVFPAHNNESKASEDHSKPYTDKFGKRHVSWTCPKCGEEFGIAGHSGEGERFEHLMSHESKATEGGSELWAYAFRTTRRNFSTPIYHIVKKKSGISPSLCGVHCDTSNAKVDATYTEFGKTFEADKCEKCLRLSHGYESKATEGGRGSGRKGHQKWMLGAEADPEECPHCMIFTEKKNGNCQICGNSY